MWAFVLYHFEMCGCFESNCCVNRCVDLCATKTHREKNHFKRNMPLNGFLWQNNNLNTGISIHSSQQWTNITHQNAHITAAQMNLHIFEIIQVVTVNDLHCILHGKINVWSALWTQNTKPTYRFSTYRTIYKPMKKKKTMNKHMYVYIHPPSTHSTVPRLELRLRFAAHFSFLSFAFVVYSVGL